MKAKARFKLTFTCIVMTYSLLLVNCAGIAPVPGGNDSVNQSYYGTENDLLDRLKMLNIGMSEEEVLSILGRKRDDLIRLQRSDVLFALYGSGNVEISDGNLEGETGKSFLQSLYGYKLNYKIVKRKIGFSSPIRIRTDEKGFDDTVTLIFRDNKLFDQAILTGGIVNSSSSSTLFDYLNPGRIIDYTGR